MGFSLVSLLHKTNYIILGHESPRQEGTNRGSFEVFVLRDLSEEAERPGCRDNEEANSSTLLTMALTLPLWLSLVVYSKGHKLLSHSPTAAEL